MPTKKLQSQSNLTKFDWPLNGKVRTDVDPVLIGETSFRQLTNMRYTNDCPKSIQGMTKINASPTSYTTIKNGFHFVKEQPTGTTESHILVQTTDAGGNNSRIVKSDNTAAVPNQDTFSTFKSLTSTNLVRFANAPDGAMMACNGVNNYIYSGSESRCSVFKVQDITETYWYDYTDNVNNTLTDAANVAKMSATSGTVILVGATRPLQGVKFYVGTANATASTLVAAEWTGATWSTLTSTDNTAISGKPLAQTGTVTWASTVATSKIKTIKDIVAYWYKFTFATMGTTATIYHCTVDAPIQDVVDIWDGNDRPVASFFKYLAVSTSYTDLSTHVYAKDYVAVDTTTFAVIGSLDPTDCLYCGFTERMMGLGFNLADDSYINTNATVMVVQYWDGLQWVTITPFVDWTASSGGESFHQSGTVTWQQLAENIEYKQNISNQREFYYYKVSFTNALSSAVRLDYVYGIPVQQKILPHKFSVSWQGRNWLCNEVGGKQNSAICSNYNTNCVFNGNDTGKMYLGGVDGLVAGETLFSRYSASVYDSFVLFKKASVYLVDGTAVSNYTKYTVSDSVGIVAPQTLQKCDVSFEVAAGVTKHVLVWQSARGIEYYDGNTLVPMSDDIQDFFNPDSANYINVSIVDKFTSSYDEKNYEYHWCFATGASTTLNQEWVLDLRRKKFYDINRVTPKLNCGFTVQDPNGLKYNYGGTLTGYLERLEYGTTFDGSAMVCTTFLGDPFLAKSAMYLMKIRHLKVVVKAKNSYTNAVVITWYPDGATAGIVLQTASMQKTGYRVCQIPYSGNLDAVMHGLKLEVTNTGEQLAFEPLLISGLYLAVREDI